MSHENVARVRAAYEALARHDLPTILGMLAPDIEVWQSDQVPWGGAHRGVMGVMGFFSALLRYVETTAEPEEIVDAGDAVVMIGRARGTVKASGAPFDVRAIHVWKLRDGLVARFEIYLDTPAMLGALA